MTTGRERILDESGLLMRAVDEHNPRAISPLCVSCEVRSGNSHHERSAASRHPRLEPYLCHDCGRRFFNVGWHAEACGSPNYRRMKRPA